MELNELKSLEQKSYLKLKAHVNINIYGAFSGGRIEKLKALRDYLRKNDYNARLSIDLKELYGKEELMKLIEKKLWEYKLKDNHEELLQALRKRLDMFYDDKYIKDDYQTIFDRIISEIFMDDGHIHIFVFFKAKKNETDLNQSPAMELERLYNTKRDEFVAVYFEKNSIRQVRTLLRGLVKTQNYWLGEFKSIEDIFEEVIGFCNNCLIKMSKL